MDINLQKVKRIDVGIQCLIFGFIRESESLLPNDTSYWNINDLIIYTVLAYYQHIEYFEYYDQLYTKISNNSYTMTNNSQGRFCTVYGTQKIPFDSKGIHEWKIQIMEKDWHAVLIGIDESDYKSIKRCFVRNNASKGYGYWSTGNKQSYCIRSLRYNAKYFKNDVVKMIFNLNDKILSYAINNKSPTEAFQIEPSNIGYSLAVSTWGQNNSVSLLDYYYHQN